jgi:hypothetical protein
MSILIQPSTITTTKTISSFTVNVMRLELFQSVTVNVMLYGPDGNFIDLRTYTLSGNDYNEWDNDDNYLINKVAENLGFKVLKDVTETQSHEQSVEPEQFP